MNLLWIDGDGRDKVREALDSLDMLEAQLEAIGAGGVSGPLMGQPQAMPDLSALTERGAKAWAGVDAQALRDGTHQQAAPKAAPGAPTVQGLQHQLKLLAEALGACILASGIVRKDIDGFDGPQLLLFAEDLRSMLEATPQPSPAPLSEMPYEKRKAIQEGEQIGASDAWFKARHEMLDTVDRRNVFRAGFDRGWNAALAAQGGRDAG